MKFFIAMFEGQPQRNAYGDIMLFRSVEEARVLTRPLTGGFEIVRTVIAAKATKREKERYAKLFPEPTATPTPDTP